MADEDPSSWRVLASVICFGAAILIGAGGFVLLVFDVVPLGGFAWIAAIGSVFYLVGLYFVAKAASR